MTENLIEGAGGHVTNATALPTDPREMPANAQVEVGDNLLGSLGLDAVEADPNAIPDGTYDAIVKSAEMVHVASKKGVAVVINYQVESGDNAGGRIGQFFNLGINPVIEEGKIKSFTPTMTTGNKQWFKKAFTDLGIPEAEVTTTPTSTLMTKIVGRKCTIGIKKRDGYRNVTFVEYRGPATPAGMTETAVAVQAAVAAQAGTPEAAVTQPEQVAMPAGVAGVEPPPF